MLALSEHLKTNIFEAYMEQLPLNLRRNWREKELLKEVDNMRKEIRKLKAENEKLWGRVLG